MNFLELCRRVEIESGTVDGAALMTTVAGPTSRRRKMIGWTQAAWEMIQGARSDWRFMRREYDAILGAGIASYTGADLSVSRFGSWYRDQPRANPPYRPHSIYDRDIGVSDTSPIQEISWTQWRDIFGRGAQTAGRPLYYAISPDEKLCLGPVPDKGYAIQGEYYRLYQSLTADTDIPEMPALHHLTIVWRALMLLGNHDEAPVTINTATANYVACLEKLERDQVDRPKIGTGAAIA